MKKTFIKKHWARCFLSHTQAANELLYSEEPLGVWLPLLNRKQDLENRGSGDISCHPRKRGDKVQGIPASGLLIWGGKLLSGDRRAPGLFPGWERGVSVIASLPGD